MNPPYSATRKGVERIVVAAFEYAQKHGRKSVTMAGKSNVLRLVTIFGSVHLVM
ncbi:isocitrate/isopropylmalate family dehydrogenase [Pelorhabdus rhamnosifermentans]|uniref:isocitrate/isopropylmalate family dehydrogenase n=1 Tax=Pelorhabdus rhamnosifermentans TaxID=2772457 RepID=UPI001C0644CE